MLLTLLPLLPLLAVLCFVAIRFWGAAIIGVLVWAMVEGAVRKWVFPGLQSQILLVKDFVLLFAYVGYFISTPRTVGMGPKSAMLALLLIAEGIFCTLELLNPNSPSFLLSLFGLKNYLIYLPLALIVPDMIADRSLLRKLMFGTCYLAIPIAALGIYQFSQPPSSWVNQYVSHEEGVEAVVSLFGEEGEGEFSLGRARTSSTFSYIGGFTTFLLLAVPLAAAMLLSGVSKQRQTLLVAGALALSLAGAATTGARTPIVVYAVALPIMLLVAGWKGLLPIQRAVRYAVAIGVLGAVTLTLFGSAFSALEYRANNSDSTIDRLFSPIAETVAAFQSSPIMGTGIGTNSNAAASLMGTGYSWWLNGYTYELETARVMQEIGFIGFTLVLLPKLFVIFLLTTFLRSSRSSLLIALYLASLIFVLAHLILFTINNPTGGLMYWTIVGVCIGARRVERVENAERLDENFYVQRGFPLGNIALA